MCLFLVLAGDSSVNEAINNYKAAPKNLIVALHRMNLLSPGGEYFFFIERLASLQHTTVLLLKCKPSFIQVRRMCESSYTIDLKIFTAIL